jgi:hypothetical protein
VEGGLDGDETSMFLALRIASPCGIDAPLLALHVAFKVRYCHSLHTQTRDDTMMIPNQK